MKLNRSTARARYARPLGLVAVTAALTLTLGGPALAQEATPEEVTEISEAVPQEGLAVLEDAKPAWDHVAPLTISPNSGGPGTSVTVRANCRPDGPATSDAFKKPIELERGDSGQWVGTGKIKHGLKVGRGYPVTVNCADGVRLTATFTATAGTPSGGAEAGFGGSGSGEEGGARATALAVGGGVAVAGGVGYVFLAKRRRSGSHSY
ncbi:hypothetical protein RM844_27935 [Streptomyces sp. DSM 44915]|uniref:Uncharacterized protein n=1 Tax=Streptomyces chisholmiae TaxID=3075540 RepID=A0ABU2JYS1_9ACTN|nr:hypothetical protein [Streptomyces sp. DSM 44915]MDT0270110.1 hypothetical protein [Streptomyces sp. DSM 44915]